MLKELWRLIKMLFVTHPSDFVYKDMEVVTMKHFPFKAFKALVWCGKIIHREGTSAVNATTINREVLAQLGKRM